MAKKVRKHEHSISCEEIVLVNARGEMQAKLSTRDTDAGASLRFYDEKGVERCVLEVEGDIVRFSMDRGAAKRPALALAVIDDHPGIRFYNGQGRCVAELGLDSDSAFVIREIS